MLENCFGAQLRGFGGDASEDLGKCGGKGVAKGDWRCERRDSRCCLEYFLDFQGARISLSYKVNSLYY